MKSEWARRLMRIALKVAYPSDAARVMRHVDEISQLELDQVEALIGSDKGMRQLAGPLRDGNPKSSGLPVFTEIAESVPGRLSDEEFARVLSGGSSTEWGPARHLARRMVKRRRPK